jgi:hypothetical protein
MPHELSSIIATHQNPKYKRVSLQCLYTKEMSTNTIALKHGQNYYFHIMDGWSLQA